MNYELFFKLLIEKTKINDPSSLIHQQLKQNLEKCIIISENEVGLKTNTIDVFVQILENIQESIQKINSTETQSNNILNQMQQYNQFFSELGQKLNIAYNSEFPMSQQTIWQFSNIYQTQQQELSTLRHQKIKTQILLEEIDVLKQDVEKQKSIQQQQKQLIDTLMDYKQDFEKEKEYFQQKIQLLNKQYTNILKINESYEQQACIQKIEVQDDNDDDSKLIIQELLQQNVKLIDQHDKIVQIIKPILATTPNIFGDNMLTLSLLINEKID